MLFFFFFFFNDSGSTVIYTLSLHDALPISYFVERFSAHAAAPQNAGEPDRCNKRMMIDRYRKSTRLNSSHLGISYAVFCLKKKKDQGWQFDLPRTDEHTSKVEL